MHKAEIKIVILWEHELIAAAKALIKSQQEGATDEDIMSAFKACYAALASPDLADESAQVTIMKAQGRAKK